MTIDRPTGQSIAALMANLRPDWDLPGCLAAVKAVARRHPGDVALAAVRLAMTPDAKTPAALGVLDGPHWREKLAPAGHRHPPRPAEECRTHAGEWAGSCRGCAADRLAPTLDLDDQADTDTPALDALAAARAELAAVRAGHCTHGVDPRRCNEAHNLDEVSA